MDGEIERIARRRRLVFGAGGLALLLATAAAPAAADPVQVEVQPLGDQARITLSWPSPVSMRTEVRDGRLTLSFDREVDADLAPVSRLAAFVGPPVLAEARRTLGLPLRQGVTALAFAEDSLVTIELLRHGQTPAGPGATAGAPAATITGETTAPPLPAVAVRSGQHRGYSRLVFDWKQKVGYRVERTGDGAVLIFDQPAEIDPRQLQRPYLKYLRGSSSARSDAETRVFLQTSPGSVIRDQRDGRNIVIDVLAPTPTEQAAVIALGAPPPQPLPAIAAPEPPQASRAEAPPPSPPPPPAPPAAAPPPPPLAAVPAAAHPAEPAVLRFEWGAPTAAAVFRRGDALWVVFDRPSQRDTAALAQAVRSAVQGIDQLPDPRATVLRIQPRGDLRPQVERDGLAWMIRLAGDVAPRPQPITPQVDAGDGGGGDGVRLMLPVAEPGEPLAVDDPSTAETIIVVPVIPLLAGIDRRWRYPQFALEETTQGIVVQSKIDSLRVRALRDGVEISSSDGLVLSTAAAAPAGATSLLKPAEWTAPRGTGFARQRQALERAIVDAEPTARAPARLRLAQFLLGRGFALEATGVLAVAAQQHPELPDQPRFRLLRGAAELLAGRNAEAGDDLRRALAAGGGDEARLWVAAARTAAGDPIAAANLALLPRWTALVLTYPPDLRAPLAALLAEAAVAGGRLDEAQKLLDVGRAAAGSAGMRARLSYLDGRRLETAGDTEAALAAYAAAAQLDPGRGRAQGELAGTLLQLGQQRLTPAEAVARLDGLRHTWRGDAVEFDVLRQLGRLQLETGDYAAGLRTLKRAVSDHADLPGAAEATRQMAAAFEQLFLAEGADRLPPITALAVWDEFRELTPPGEKGRLMIRRLADRLVAADLLDRAAALVEGLLPGAGAGERAALGARLAEIRILDGKPEAALATLQQTSAPALPPDVSRRRSLAQAQALLALGRQEEALAAIDKDAGLDAELLRARLYRSRNDWPRAATALRRIVEASRAVPEPLDERRARAILDLAVALTLAGDAEQLAQIDGDYRNTMAATPLKDAFRLLAGAGPPPGADAAALAELVERATAFRRSLDPAAGQ